MIRKSPFYSSSSLLRKSFKSHYDVPINKTTIQRCYFPVSFLLLFPSMFSFLCLQLSVSPKDVFFFFFYRSVSDFRVPRIDAKIITRLLTTEVLSQASPTCFTQLNRYDGKSPKRIPQRRSPDLFSFLRHFPPFIFLPPTSSCLTRVSIIHAPSKNSRLLLPSHVVYLDNREKVRMKLCFGVNLWQIYGRLLSVCKSVHAKYVFSWLERQSSWNPQS